MHPLRLALAIVVVAAAHALAAPIDVTKGFAGATWGMSPAEVAKATGAVDAGFVPSAHPEVPTMVFVKYTQDGRLGTYYVFYEGKLVQIYRLSNLDTFGLNPAYFVEPSLTSDGSVEIDASMDLPPSFLPRGEMKSAKVGPYNFGLSLTCKSLKQAISEAWMQEQVTKLKTQTLPKLVE